MECKVTPFEWKNLSREKIAEISKAKQEQDDFFERKYYVFGGFYSDIILGREHEKETVSQ